MWPDTGTAPIKWNLRYSSSSGPVYIPDLEACLDFVDLIVSRGGDGGSMLIHDTPVEESRKETASHAKKKNGSTA